MSAVKVRKKPLTKRCQKGYPCKTTCINRDKNCRNPLKWQAKDLAGWLKLQEERLAVTNQKRSRAGLTPATMNDMGYISADRIKRSGSVKSVEPKESPVTTVSPSEKPTVAKMFAHAVKGGVIQAVGLKGDDYQFTYRKKEGIAKPHIELRNLATGEIKKVPMTQKAFRDYLSRLDDVSPANARLVDGFSDSNELDKLEADIESRVKKGQITQSEYLDGWKKILGEKEFAMMKSGISNDWYNTIESYLKKGGEISQEIVDSMTQGQRYSWAKQFNYGNTQVIRRELDPNPLAPKVEAPDYAIPKWDRNARKEGDRPVELDQDERVKNLKIFPSTKAVIQSLINQGISRFVFDSIIKHSAGNYEGGGSQISVDLSVNSSRLNKKTINELISALNPYMATIPPIIKADGDTLSIIYRNTNTSYSNAMDKMKDVRDRLEVMGVNVAHLHDIKSDSVVSKNSDRPVESKPENGDRPSPVPNAGEQLKYNELTKLRHRALLGMSKGRTPKDSRELYDRVQSELNEFEKRFPGIKHTITQNEREKAQWDKTESEGLKTLSAYQEKLAKKSTPSPATENSDRPVENGIKSFKHTRYGHQLFAVVPSSDLTPKQKQEFAAKAKSLNGRYSPYDKDGAIAGYLFRDKKKAEQFQDWMNGKSSPSSPGVSRQPTEVKPVASGDRASVVPELVKEKRPHPSEMSISDKLTELLEHYESANPIPQFRKGLSGKYAAVGSDGSTYGKQYETEADGINAAKEYQKQRVEDSYGAVRKMSEKQIDRQIEYWRKQRGIETNSAPPTPTPPSDSTYQPTAKEFGDRLNVTAEDFKGNALYLGVAPDSGGYSYSDRDKEWIKSKYGDVNYGDEYRIVKEGDSIAIEKRSIVYKKDGDPISDRLSEGDWKSWYGKQNISWNQESLVSKIANFNITEKPHPLVTNANADKEKRRIQKEKEEKERQIKAEQQQAELTAWTAIKKEMVKALPKPKQKQSVTWKGEDGKDRNGIADLYGDNYAITQLVGSRGNGRFSVADVSSGFLAYKSGLTATEAKELLGILWKERGDKPIMKGESLDISDDLREIVRSYGDSDAIPKIYSQVVTDHLNAGKEQKAQALQSNLFGGLDEIPVDEKREAAIAAQSEAETTKKMKALEGFRPSVKPRGDNLSDKELEERIKESNDYFNSIGIAGGKRLKKATEAFYRYGEPEDGFSGDYTIEKIFKGIDDYQETGNKQKILVTEVASVYGPRGNYAKKEHILDPSDEKGILDFLRVNMKVNVSSDDTIEDVRERFNEMRAVKRQAVNVSRPKWLDAPSSSVTYSSGVSGIGLTPTTKGFVAEQLFKLGAFDFPSRVDYDKEPPMVTIRTPGGGQYQIYKTKEALSTFLGAIGLSPKKGESLFDSLKRNSEKVQNFSELTISPRDRHLLLLATTAANRILEYPEFLRQGILNRLGGLA